MKKHIDFTRNERNGLLVISLAVLAFIVHQVFIIYKSDPLNERISFDKIEKSLNAMENQKSNAFQYDSTVKKTVKNDYYKKRKMPRNSANGSQPASQFTKFSFDPNTLESDSLKSLGFTDFAIKNLQKYLSKGGKINQASDLKRIYGVDEDFYEAIKPWVVIRQITLPQEDKKSVVVDSLRNNKNADFKAFSKMDVKPLNINSAIEEDWQQLRGIGPVFADRIVKYRKGLGGFHNINQLKEVFGFPDSTFQSIKDKLLVDSVVELQKIDINFVDYETLKKHFYLDYKLASIIINYRDQHGSFSTSDDLLKIKIMKKETVDKLSPYLNFRQ